MRKVLSALVLLSLVVVPMVALAQQVPECCILKRAITIDTTTCEAGNTVAETDAKGDVCSTTATNCSTPKWGLFCLINTINVVVDWIFVVLITLAVVLVILGAFNIMTAAGDPTKVGTGKNYIISAAIGLIVAFLARAIPAIVKTIMG